MYAALINCTQVAAMHTTCVLTVIVFKKDHPTALADKFIQKCLNGKGDRAQAAILSQPVSTRRSKAVQAG